MAGNVTQKPSDIPHPEYRLWGFALFIWSLYRYYVHLPEWIDELISKPLVFVAPVLWYVTKREKRSFESIGITGNNFFKALYTGLGLGVIFAIEAITANALKYGKLNVHPLPVVGQYGLVALLVISLSTAFSEELLTRGFLFTRIYERTKNLPFASVMSTLLFLLLHVPILVTSLKLQGTTLILYFVTDLVLGLANSMLFFYTDSLVAPILVHVFWNLTVALYL